MLQADKFTTILLQASLFTPGLRLNTANLFMFLMGEYGDSFNGEPTLNGQMEKVPSPFNVPVLMLQNAAKSIKLSASHERLDLFRDEESTAQESDAFLLWAVDLLSKYASFNKTRVGRLALIAQRVTPSANPAIELSRHFCQERWTNTAINRPQDFELHSHKCFKMGELFDVNSWVRCKTAIKREPEVAGVNKANLVLVEQDINSLGEAADIRDIPEAELRRFFPEAMIEMAKVLALYFPTI